MQVARDDPKLSTWTLQTEQFGRHWTFSWNAQLLTPVRRQKIHWRSVPVRLSFLFGGAQQAASGSLM